MELIKFITWLTAGAVVGWFANQMVKKEHRQTRKPAPVTVKVSSSEKS